MSNKARRPNITSTINGLDITNYVIDLNYTDNYDKTDDIRLTLSNRERELCFETGDIITASIDGFNLGSFEIDQIEQSQTLRIDGVAAPVTSSARSEWKNEAWAKIPLSGIAGDIAGNAGLALLFDTTVDPFYDQADQNNKSDLEFLEELCKSDGLCMKVTDGQLIVYEEAKRESLPPIDTITKGDSYIIGHPRFTRNAKNIYKACEILYFCPKTDELYRGYFEAPNIPTGHTLKLREDYNSESDDINLDRKSRARLRERNKDEWQCNITLKGDTKYESGANVEFEGFNNFDGKYHIARVSHSVNNGGYIVSLGVRRCLGY